MLCLSYIFFQRKQDEDEGVVVVNYLFEYVIMFYMFIAYQRGLSNRELEVAYAHKCVYILGWLNYANFIVYML